MRFRLPAQLFALRILGVLRLGVVHLQPAAGDALHQEALEGRGVGSGQLHLEAFYLPLEHLRSRVAPLFSPANRYFFHP